VIHDLVTSVTKWGPQTLYLAGGGLAGKRDIPASKEVYLQTTALTMNSRVIASGHNSLHDQPLIIPPVPVKAH
jgi:hypothetical protein